MKFFSASPLEIIATHWRNRELIYVSAKREVLGRYQGSFFGLMWSFFNPLFMLTVYTFVFSEIFKARWGEGSGSKIEFALVLFAGLIVYNLFTECINKAPGLILGNSNYVKKIIFPLEILPCVSLLSALYHALISVMVWIFVYSVTYGIPHYTIFFLPLILVPFCILILGCSWILSSLGVYLRDVSQIIGVITSVLMFLSPLFYPTSALPERYRDLLFLNPLTFVIEEFRNLMYWGRSPDWTFLSIYWVISISVACIGFIWFQKTRKGFADVL